MHIQVGLLLAASWTFGEFAIQHILHMEEEILQRERDLSFFDLMVIIIDFGPTFYEVLK